MRLMGLLFWQFHHYAHISRLVKLYVSHIQQHLEYAYACPIWDPSTVKDHDLVENVQRFSQPSISQMWDGEYMEMLNLPSLETRRKVLKTVMAVYNCQQPSSFLWRP